MKQVANTPFAQRLWALMVERGYGEYGDRSKLAAKMWGRERDARGTNVAINRDRITQWLNGENEPHDEYLALLAKHLNCEPNDLIPDTERKSVHRSAADWSELETSKALLEAELRATKDMLAEIRQERDDWKAVAMRLTEKR